MKISASFLSIKEDLKNNIKKLDNSNIDYLHLDIMDNIFVPNITWHIEEITNLLDDTKSKRDVHLMVKDVISYIDEYSKLNPEFITFHFEAATNVLDIINYIKNKNIKVGLSIKPNTKVEEIVKYLPFIDLVLVMSVEPGFGGQAFIPDSINKIEELYNIRAYNNYNYLIEVDGGINSSNIKDLDKCDIVVVGSFITNNSDYNKAISELDI